jgi:general stress protein 26
MARFLPKTCVMNNETDTVDHKKVLRETLQEASTVMLVTRESQGELHSRPMAVARVDDANKMYFATSVSSPKVTEIRADSRVDAIFQSKTRYASIAGRATISQDRQLIEELWQESWKVWFENGKSDPDIAIVILDPERGEYWDQSGIKGLSYLFRAAKAYVTGTEMKKKESELHGEVKL